MRGERTKIGRTTLLTVNKTLEVCYQGDLDADIPACLNSLYHLQTPFSLPTSTTVNAVARFFPSGKTAAFFTPIHELILLCPKAIHRHATLDCFKRQCYDRIAEKRRDLGMSVPENAADPQPVRSKLCSSAQWCANSSIDLHLALLS